MDALAATMAERIAGRVHTGNAMRAAYASDASNHRVLPRIVAIPQDRDDVSHIVTLAADAGEPITVRGGGTGIAGGALGTGVVIDTTSLDTIEFPSPARSGPNQTDGDDHHVTVEAGVVLADLQRQLAVRGRRFGPDPSSATRCTLGGMLSTDACGAHSIAWGATSDNTVDIELVGADGVARWVQRDAGLQDPLSRIVDRFGDAIAVELGRFSRQKSGYGLHHLVPSADTRQPLAASKPNHNVARALVGSEGTCGVVTRAVFRTVETPLATVVVVAGFASEHDAARAAAALRAPDPDWGPPLTIEGFGAALVEMAQRARPGRRHHADDLFPTGDTWLLIECGGSDPVAAREHGHAIGRRLTDRAVDVSVISDPAAQQRVWKLRNLGAGLATRTAAGREAWPGWEDAAVPPENLADYLIDFRRLLQDHGRHGVTYGHFGEGCVHVRIDHDLDTPPGRDAFARFQNEAADIVISHGGSLSGEHGDGRARSGLLSRMYTSRMIEGFSAFKSAFDPTGVFNPGILVDPVPVDADLRLAIKPDRDATVPVSLGFSYPDDRDRDGRPSLSVATRRCVGVGSCRATSGGGMCPSFRATGDERDSTRGRARILYEMLNGVLADEAWTSDEVAAALDGCLACKACVSECPTQVDMALYKAEFLHQRYRGRVRPRSHYSLGWLPRWLRWARRAPGVWNRVVDIAAVRRLAGLSPSQPIPRVPSRSTRRARPEPRPGSGRGVVLWNDSFTATFAPEVAAAAERVLVALGWNVSVVGPRHCCGLPALSTGQLERARATIVATVEHLDHGTDPIVALEPSCAATLVHDAPRLAPGEATDRVAKRVRTLAEVVVDTPTWRERFTAVDRAVVTQFHCHHRAVLGVDADLDVLAALGASVHNVTEGCCGLAGSFGLEPGHEDIARIAAQQSFVPVLDAQHDALVLADGVSCRTQVAAVSNRQPLHLAVLLDNHLIEP